MISSDGSYLEGTHESIHESNGPGPLHESSEPRRDRESRAIDFIRQIESLDDHDLLSRLKGMVTRERRSTTQLLAHLAVLDGRRLFIAQGYSSLFNYCTRGLHFSEQAAYLRIEAARVVRRFPAVLARVADGSIHLTALSLLRPHLTTENHRQLLDAACHRSRREIEDLVTTFRSGPAVPPRARFTVVPQPASPHNSDRSVTGRVSSLTESTGPGNPMLPVWQLATNPDSAGGLPFWLTPEDIREIGAEPGVHGSSGGETRGDVDGIGCDMDVAGGPSGTGREAGGTSGTDHVGGGTIGSERTPSSIRGSEQSAAWTGGSAFGAMSPLYRLHLTISAETRLKLVQARELLRHQVPDGDPAKILDRALGVLLDRLEQRKFARLVTRPDSAIGLRSAVDPHSSPNINVRPATAEDSPFVGSPDLAPRPGSTLPSTRRRATDSARGAEPALAPALAPTQAPRQASAPAPPNDQEATLGSRNIPAVIRREVWYRDEGRCAFVGEDGVRCDSRGHLEFHHLVPWAEGGATTPGNLALRCRVHNAWESEIHFARSAANHGADPEYVGDVGGDIDPLGPDYAKPVSSSVPDELGPDRVEGDLTGPAPDALEMRRVVDFGKEGRVGMPGNE